MSDSIYAPRSDKKFGAKDSVANCQPKILRIVGEWFGDLVVRLLFSYYVFWTSKKGISTQVGHLLFSGQFKQTKIGDLATCLEIVKIRKTEYLSYWVFNNEKQGCYNKTWKCGKA